MNVDMIPGHNPNMVPADPNSVFGGPKYPKQTIAACQSFPGAGGAMPIYGMIIGQIPRQLRQLRPQQSTEHLRRRLWPRREFRHRESAGDGDLRQQLAPRGDQLSLADG